jgi:hypothetical protein
MGAAKRSRKAVSSSGGTTASKLRAGVGSFLNPSRVNRPQGANGAARPAQNKGVWRRIFIGMFVFIIGAQVFEYVLLFVDQRFFNLTLEKNMVAASSVPLLGSMNIFTFVYLLFILLLYIGLLRFNVLPSSKDLRNQRARATTTTAASPGASRAARKRAARQASSSASVHTATTTARVKSGQVGQHQVGQHDDVYERVKAAQRLRRRRETKR